MRFCLPGDWKRRRMLAENLENVQILPLAGPIRLFYQYLYNRNIHSRSATTDDGQHARELMQGTCTPPDAHPPLENIYIHILAPLEDVRLVEFMYLACQVRVIAGNSGLCCVCVTSFWLAPLCVDSAWVLWAWFGFRLWWWRCYWMADWHGWRERHHSVQCQLDVVAAWPDQNIFKCFVQNKKGFFSCVKSRMKAAETCYTHHQKPKFNLPNTGQQTTQQNSSNNSR